MDRVFNPLITAAAADIARHGLAYLIVGGLWIVQKKRRRLHDLSGLAITALRDIALAPGFLNRVVARGVRPSIVVTSRVTTSETEVMQDRTASLSTMTVHEPQSA